MSNKQKQFHPAAINSFGTSTHETGTSAITLTGNPFTDLAAHGIDLHGYSIRHYRGKNGRGHSITGRFNISGRETTAGVCSYEELIAFLVQKHQEYRWYVSECHHRKRERYSDRHPEYSFRNPAVTVM